MTCNRRQFSDTIFKPTSSDTNQSLIEGSGSRSPLSEKAPDSAGRVDQGNQLLTPSSAQEPHFEEKAHTADDSEFATIRQWLKKTQTRWEYVSRAGFQVAQEAYSSSTSTRPILEPRGRTDPLAPFKGILMCALGLLAALVFCSSIVTVPLTDICTGVDNASISPDKADSLDTLRVSPRMEERIRTIASAESADRQWSKTVSLSAHAGRQSNSDSEESKPLEALTLSDEMIDAGRYSKCTVLQRLNYHKRTCPWFWNVEDPLEEDESAISKSQWEEIKRLHNDVCERLQHVPSDVASYHLEVKACMNNVHKHALYVQNATREGTTQPPKGQPGDATEVLEVAMSQVIPIWQLRLASLNTLAAPLLQTLIDLQVDLSALKNKLVSARIGLAFPRSEVLESLSRPRMATGWTEISQPENMPVSDHTKAINGLIEKWYPETSSLKNVVSEVYFELVDLDGRIRDVVRKRLSFDAPYPWSSADSPELSLFLTRISQEIRRIRVLTQSSKSMQGWGEAEGGKETKDPGKPHRGDDAKVERRTVAWV